MGLRNPVFTNVISLVNFAANVNDVYRIAESAVTGEKVTPTQSYQTAPIRQTSEAPTTAYEESDELDYQEPEESQSGESLTDKVKGFFSNIFD
jgi:cell division protein FtsA